MMNQVSTDPSITDQLRYYQQRTNDLMLCQIDQSMAIPSSLQQAIRYSVANGGKRLRPCLVYITAHLFNTPASQCDAAAMAVEYIHTYSLIHDDLPAMDDDDMRRGQPSCHVAYDEATAILAGDALQSLAFETLSTDSPWHSSEQQLRMINTLSQAVGASGMVGGQMLDLDAENNHVAYAQLQTIHLMKTGALIQASIILGAICAHIEDDRILHALSKFGHHIGLAFQIQDDILDVTADSETLGKPSQSDIAANKSTYVSLLGVEKAKQTRDQQLQMALDALHKIDNDTTNLEQLANKLVQRSH